MTRADAAHARDISLACVVACDSVGVITVQSAYIKFDILMKFIRTTLRSVARKKLTRLLQTGLRKHHQVQC